MRRRIAIYGATEEALELVPLLLANSTIEITSVVDVDQMGTPNPLTTLPAETTAALRGRLHTDSDALTDDPNLFAVIDATGACPETFPQLTERGVQIVTPLVARLLWCYGAGDRKSELLRALQEVVASYNLTVDPKALFQRMLEIALGVTGADGGSVLLLDEHSRELRIRVAVGIEPELWEKIRLPLGEGIAGRVAEDARPLRLLGKADPQNFRIVRERLDIESSICVPLIHEDRVLGVLSLHHGARRDAFDEADLAFAEQLAQLDAQIIARAQQHEALRGQAARYTAVREVRAVLGSRAPLPERLARLCQIVSTRSGSGIVHLYLHEADQSDITLAASSLEGPALGEEVRVPFGRGIDGEAARTREPVILRTRSDLAYAALPLLSGEALVGVLTLQAGAGSPESGDFEETLLEMAAAAAEEIADLRRAERVEAQAARLSAINDAGIRVMSLSDPAAVLRQGTSSAAMVLDADHAVLRLRDEGTERYAIRSYFGSADGRFQDRLFRLDKRVSVAVLKRRAPLLAADLAADPAFAEFSPEIRSAIAVPIRREGSPIGTLALYDKLSTAHFAPRAFAESDLELLSKFASNLESAVANVQFIWRARQFRSFDEATGLPNRAYLDRRLREEIARSRGRHGTVAVAVCRIENHAEILARRGPRFADGVVQRVADSLRTHLRDFDVAGRTGDAEFAALLPDPGPEPADRVSELARSLAEDISKDDALNDPVRVGLVLGYAVHPEEGDDAETLLENAAEPKIRMV